MKKNIFRTIHIVIMVVGILNFCPLLNLSDDLFIVTIKAYAATISNTPNLSSSSYGSQNIFGENYKGRGTWFCWGRVSEKLNIKLSSEFWGHASSWWDNNAKSKKYNYGNEPRANSIAVWGGGNGNYGHVAFVEKVEGNTVYFNEANLDRYRAYDGALESLPKDKMIKRGTLYLKGYIYLTNNTTTTSSYSKVNAGQTVLTTTKNYSKNSTAKSMQVSDNLVNFIAQYEWFSSKPYSGFGEQHATIGYGHVIRSGENFSNGITRQKGKELLKEDLQRTVNEVNRLVSGVHLTQQQFDALVSFAFNCGSGGLSSSTLLKDVKSGNITSNKIKGDFQAWSYSNKTRLLGLWRRRTDEWQIFSHGDYKRNYPLW
ncbi:hypothetical protein CPJCM30710_29120 [Clostridium polyendosporum]|uniref:Lysozyme n=1 Tax=Clostridium polyendosporum TaxID=69208 RepID=A0A919S1J4_9CLOT|nr:CHAP domain-containing protein [Clostridium polyendosporum]GIM30246.1 hypothetical protein CPJCM30710_29120 [Clostridium polyendosporum]